MPSSGPFWQTSLSKRVRHLERAIKPDQKAQQRAYLERCFAGPEYDDHRAALIEALLSDFPQYDFIEGETAYLVSWWQRERLQPFVIRTYSALFAAI